MIKDLTNRVLYYRCYDDTALRMIDMEKLDFSKGAGMKSIPIENPPTIIDVTSELQS